MMMMIMMMMMMMMMTIMMIMMLMMIINIIYRGYKSYIYTHVMPVKGVLYLATGPLVGGKYTCQFWRNLHRYHPCSGVNVRHR